MKTSKRLCAVSIGDEQREPVSVRLMLALWSAPRISFGGDAALVPSIQCVARDSAGRGLDQNLPLTSVPGAMLQMTGAVRLRIAADVDLGEGAYWIGFAMFDRS